MTERSPADRLLRRARIAGWTTAGAASIATVGLIAGIGHTATAANSSTTPATTPSTSTSTSATTPSTSTSTTPTTPSASSSSSSDDSNVGNADQGAHADGGSNGS